MSHESLRRHLVDLLKSRNAHVDFDAAVGGLPPELRGKKHPDLFAEIPWGDGQTILRELLLVADHNAYHVGQIVQVRRALGVWDGGPGEVV